MIIVAAALSCLSLLRYMHMEAGEDLAMFDQMLWSVRQGQGLVTSISGNTFLQFPHHFFGEHVSPILYLLAWPAGLTRGPAALLIIQALAFAAAAFPLRRLVLRLTASPRLATAAAFVWLLQPALWRATLYDFHMEAFEAYFLFSFALAFIAGTWRAWLWAALYASCKEDAPLYLAATAFLLGWKFQRLRTGTAIAALSILYAAAAILWIGPAFSPTNAPLLASRLITPASCDGLWPWLQRILLHEHRWQFMLRHLFALGLLPLLGGWLLIPAAMTIGIMWISVADPQALILLHYPYTVAPPLALAAALGLQRAARLHARLPKPWLRNTATAALAMLLLISLATLWRTQARECLDISIGRAAPFAASYRQAAAAMAAIPPDRPVAALPTLSAHVARRANLSLILRGCDAATLVLPLDGIIHPLFQNTYTAWLDTLLATNSPYGVEAVGGNHVLILRRGAPTSHNAAARSLPRAINAIDLKHRTGAPALDPRALTGRAWHATRAHRPGHALYGPHLPLAPGRYQVAFRVRATRLKPEFSAIVDVAENNGNTVLAEARLERPTHGYEWITLGFTATGATDLEFRCATPGRGTLYLDQVRWQRLDMSKPTPFVVTP